MGTSYQPSKLRVIKASSQEALQGCLDIQKRVFVDEQQVAESLVLSDHLDAVYFLALYDSHVIATGRFRVVHDGVKFERIATLREYRGVGVGHMLMKYMQAFAQQFFFDKTLYLYAQKEVKGFYEKLGWKAVGSEFKEANIVHIKMIYERSC